MKKELALRTLLYLQILISLQISFTFLNSVFFIYKYEQLQSNRDISVVVFCIPSLVYHVVKLFVCYYKRYFYRYYTREETTEITEQYTGNGIIKEINNNVSNSKIYVDNRDIGSNTIRGCDKKNEGSKYNDIEEDKDIRFNKGNNTLLNTTSMDNRGFNKNYTNNTLFDNDDTNNTLLDTSDMDNTLLYTNDMNKTLLNTNDNSNTLLDNDDTNNTLLDSNHTNNTLLYTNDIDNTLLDTSDNSNTLLYKSNTNNTLLNTEKFRRDLYFLKGFYTNLYKKGYTLSIAISILLKVLSYFVDKYFLRKYICCIFLSLINIIISINDIYYTSILEKLKSRIENGVLLSVFIDEIPTYMFVGFFSYLEWMFNKSVKPYFDLCAIVYLISGLLLWRISKMGVIKDIDSNAGFNGRSVIKEDNKSCNEKKVVIKSNNNNKCKYKGVNNCNNSNCNEWAVNAMTSCIKGVNNCNNSNCNEWGVNAMTSCIKGVNNCNNSNCNEWGVNDMTCNIKGVNICNDSCYLYKNLYKIDTIENPDCVSLYKAEERDMAIINSYVSKDTAIYNKNILMDSSLPNENIYEEFDDIYYVDNSFSVSLDQISDEKSFNLDNLSNDSIAKNVHKPISPISSFGNNTKANISENNLSYEESNRFMAFLLLIGKTICTLNDTLIYFFLITDMSEESYLLLYFSVEFLLRTIQIQVKRWFYHFMVFKWIVALLCLYFVAYRNILKMYFFTFFLFIINGVTNQMMYYTFNRKVEGCVGEHLCDLFVFFVVSIVELYFYRKGGKSFKDFIFFTTIRL